jgi:hypothetical protein
MLLSFVDILAAEQTPDNPTWFELQMLLDNVCPFFKS